MQASGHFLRSVLAGIVWISVLSFASPRLRAEEGVSLTVEQKEEFLRTARIVADKPAKKGVTDTRRVTLTDGKVTHDANVQRIDGICCNGG